MVKKQEKTAGKTAKASKTNESVIVNLDLERVFRPDWGATIQLETLCPEWLSNTELNEMVDALRGLDRTMAQVVANCLCDCWCGYRICLTGVKHIDMMLLDFYQRILDTVKTKGAKLEPAF